MVVAPVYSDSLPSQWIWNFGDKSGTITTKTDTVYHTFLVAGDYNIDVKTFSPNCSGESSITDYMVYSNNCSATFTVNQLNDSVFQFVNTSLKYENVRWYIDSNDPVVDSLKSYTYKFDWPGTHEVWLEVSNSTGCDVYSETHFVDVIGTDCYGEFYTDVTDSLQLTFYGSYYNSDNTTATWKWYFGDGDSLIVKNSKDNNDTVVHTYKASDFFNAVLIIDGNVCSSMYEQTVSTTVVFCATPIITKVKGIGRDTLILNASSKATSYNWEVTGDYGMDNYYTTKDSTTTIGFPTDGSYWVYVNTVNNNNGCNEWPIRSK